MKPWLTKPLGEICVVDWGNTNLTKSAYVEGGRYLAVSAAGCDGRIDHKEHTKHTPVLSAIGAQCGRMFLPEEDFTAIKNTITLTPREGVCTGKFLYQLLTYVELPKRGAAQPFISKGDIQTFQVPIPTLADQERIVKLLDEADGLRKLRAQANRRATALVPALFHEMFGDPSTNSRNWSLLPVGALIEACDYGTSQKANIEGRGVLVLRMGNVTSEGQLDLEDLKTVELAEDQLAKQRLQAGDVLFNRTNSRELVGKTGMWDGRFEAVAASYFIRLRFRPDIEHPQHFTTFMNLPLMKQRLAEMARGAVGQANINSKELKSIVVPVPPLALQNEFAQRVREIRELEVEQDSSRKYTDALFHSLLHNAFNGEL